MRDGTLATFAAALSADTTATGKDFAGSVSVNRILDTTRAVLDGVTVTQAKSVDLDAENNATMIAIGGGASFTKGGVGIGASIGFNQISAQTEACDAPVTDRRASLTVGSLTALAKNDGTIDAIGVSAGIAVGNNGSVAGAFTLGIDVISSSPSIFSSTPGIIATIQNADVIVVATGAISNT